MSSPQYSVVFSAPVAGTVTAGSVGDVLIPDATSGLYVKSTTANRGTRRSTGLALSAYATGGVTDIQQVGQVDAVTAGLGTGTASWVRVSVAGTLERATVSGADDVVGWVEVDGTLHACFGFLTAAIVNAAGGGGGTVPTGTGIPHVVAGVLMAASSLVVDADVSASAAVAVSKLAPGTNTFVITTTGGVAVWAAPAGGGTPGGTSGQVQYNNAGAFGGAVNVLTGSGFLSIGAAPAASGGLRVSNGVGNGLNGKNTGGTDVTIAEINASDGLNLWGTTAAYGNLDISIGSGAAVRMQTASVSVLSVSGTVTMNGVPIVGWVSPYAVHGLGVQAMADANQTPAAAVYMYRTIKTTGANTATRTLTVPDGGATDPGAREFTLRNTCTGAFSITVSTGAGTTINVANGKTAVLGVDSGGVYRVTADV